MYYRSHFARAFHIPPDFDDTFVNLGLGALLSAYKEEFPESYQLWLSQNTALDTIWQALKAYAYRPFSNDSRINTVDTRTYFYIRGFLEEAMRAGKDVALIPTWVSRISTKNFISGRSTLYFSVISDVQVFKAHLTRPKF